jgi:hypothetical protein
LNQLSLEKAPIAQRDFVGYQLYQLCVGSLEDALRLNAEKRLVIAKDVYSEARMLDDTVAEADNFLCRWRRARQLLYREELVQDDTARIIGEAAGEGVSGPLLAKLQKTLEATEKIELHDFLETRVSKTVFEWLMNYKPKPITIDQCVALIPEWIETKRRDKTVQGRIAASYEDSITGRVPPPPQPYSGSVSQPDNGTQAGYGDGSIQALGQSSSPGYQASYGQRQPKGGGKSRSQPVPAPPGTPVCLTCGGKHSDLRTCPKGLASQEAGFVPSADSVCRWKVNGQWSCDGKYHFARHHRAQFVYENPGKSTPDQGKG